MDDRTGPDPTDLWKQELRRRLTAVRRALPADVRAAAAVAVAGRVLALPELADVAVVAAYAGHGAEVATRDLLDGLRRSGREVLLPLVVPDGGLEWARYDGWDALVPGGFGIPAPRPDAVRRTLGEAGLVVVPGIGFDASGRRLGRGAGYYDRALAHARAALVGVAYDECVVARVPAAAYDVAVDIVVTPTRVLRVAALDADRGPRQN